MEPLQQVSEITISYSPVKREKYKVTTSQSAFNYLIKFYPAETIHLKEHFMVMYVNRHNNVLGVYKLSEGGLSATIADVRLIIGIALKIAAHGIVLSHNHPSGELKPSVNDINMTKKIMEACSLMELMMIDHLIIGGKDSYLSLVDEGVV